MAGAGHPLAVYLASECADAGRRAQSGDDVLGIGGDAVLVQIETVQFALLRDAQQCPSR